MPLALLCSFPRFAPSLTFSMNDIVDRVADLPYLVLRALFVHVHYVSALILEHAPNPNVRALARACRWRDVWVDASPQGVCRHRAMSFAAFNWMVWRNRPPPARIYHLTINVVLQVDLEMALGWRGYLENHVSTAFTEVLIDMVRVLQQPLGSLANSPAFNLVSLCSWYVCNDQGVSRLSDWIANLTTSLVRVDIKYTILSEHPPIDMTLLPPTIVQLRVKIFMSHGEYQRFDFRHISSLRDLSFDAYESRGFSNDSLLLPDTLKRLQIVERGMMRICSFALPSQLEQLSLHALYVSWGSWWRTSLSATLIILEIYQLLPYFYGTPQWTPLLMYISLRTDSGLKVFTPDLQVSTFKTTGRVPVKLESVPRAWGEPVSVGGIRIPTKFYATWHWSRLEAATSFDWPGVR